MRLRMEGATYVQGLGTSTAIELMSPKEGGGRVVKALGFGAEGSEFKPATRD